MKKLLAKEALGDRPRSHQVTKCNSGIRKVFPLSSNRNAR